MLQLKEKGLQHDTFSDLKHSKSSFQICLSALIDTKLVTSIWKSCQLLWRSCRGVLVPKEIHLEQEILLNAIHWYWLNGENYLKWCTTMPRVISSCRFTFLNLCLRLSSSDAVLTLKCWCRGRCKDPLNLLVVAPKRVVNPHVYVLQRQCSVPSPP